MNAQLGFSVCVCMHMCVMHVNASFLFLFCYNCRCVYANVYCMCESVLKSN